MVFFFPCATSSTMKDIVVVVYWSIGAAATHSTTRMRTRTLWCQFLWLREEKKSMMAFLCYC